MAFTKVTNAGIGSTNTVLLHNLNVVGTVTATDGIFSGIGSFGGNVSVGGVLTYEDVTNVDSVGLITARKGISVLGAGVTIAGGGLNVNAGVSTFGGNVTVGSGITLSPDGDVYVTGISTFGGDVLIDGDIKHIGDTNTAIRFPAADTITAETGGSERIRITSDGYFGVGQTPTTMVGVTLAAQVADGTDDGADWGAGGIFQLNASGSAAAGNEILFVGAHSGGLAQIASGIGFGRHNTSDWGTYLSFKTHASDTSNIDSVVERVRISAGGDVSIGGHATNYATSPLEVRGTTAGGDVAIRVTNDSTTAGSQAGIIFTTTTADYTTAGIAYERGGTADALRFYVGQSSGGGGFTNATERLRITSTGHMGLGVTPSAWPTNGDSRGFQIGSGGSLFGRGSGDEDRAGIAANYYTDGSAIRYIGNGNANRIYMADGNITFEYAATNSSGAGAAMTLVEYMKINTNGYPEFTGASDIRLTLGSTGTAGNNDSNWVRGEGANFLSNAASGYHHWEIGGAERMHLDTNGNLFLRATPAGSRYVILGSGGDSGKTISNNMNWVRGNGDNLQLNCADGGFIAFETGGTERMRIHDSLYTSFGTTAINPDNGGTVIEGGVGHLILSRSNTNGEVMIRFNRGGSTRGNVTVSTSTTYNTTSDYRLKENVTDLTDAITRLKKITPRRFNFIEDENKQLVDGFIAHEVSEAVPESVSGTKDQVATADDVAANNAKAVGEPIHQQVDYSKYVPLLTAALQEAITEIEILKSEVAALKSS